MYLLYQYLLRSKWFKNDELSNNYGNISSSPSFGEILSFLKSKLCSRWRRFIGIITIIICHEKRNEKTLTKPFNAKMKNTQHDSYAIRETEISIKRIVYKTLNQFSGTTRTTLLFTRAAANIWSHVRLRSS